MGRNLIETIMGAVVLVVAAFFLGFAYTHADLKEVRGYAISARFTNAAGLDRGADVRINGIKVGTVASMTLDPQTFVSVVTFNIAKEIQLPDDTVGSIGSDGLLGSRYVQLLPGHGKAMLAAGATLAHTKDFKSVEEMVGDLIFLATSDAPKPEAPKVAPQSTDAVAPAATPVPGDQK